MSQNHLEPIEEDLTLYVKQHRIFQKALLKIIMLTDSKRQADTLKDIAREAWNDAADLAIARKQEIDNVPMTVDTLKTAIIESHKYRERELLKEVTIEAARSYLNAIMDGESLQSSIQAQVELEKALLGLDALD